MRNKNYRRGSIVAVMAMLGVLFISAMGLVFHASGERKSVKQMLGHLTSARIALSGIDWAEAQLRDKRWYGLPFKREIVKGRSTFGIKVLDFPDGGQTTVVCQDVVAEKPLTNTMGMQELWLLHHIDVFSLGVSAGKKSLYYSRFIISPEPALNSDSTDGLKYSVEGMSPFDMSVEVPLVNEDGGEIQKFKVSKILGYKGKEVDINTVVAELTPEAPKSSTIYQIRPDGIGKISNINLKKGDICNSGETILTVAKNPLGKNNVVANIRTLKKMVRITKIDLGLFPNFDIESLTDRETVAHYINETADAYLINFVAHGELNNAIETKPREEFPEIIKSADLYKLFPTNVTSMTKQRAENIFLTYLLKNFTAPGCKWEKRDKAKKASFLQLDHKRTAPPQRLFDKLKSLNMTWVLNTKPRLDARYYDPKMYDNQFLDLLAPEFNLPVEQFLQQLSGLPDASRMIDIKEGPQYKNASKREDDKMIEIIDPSTKPYPVKVTVQKIRKKYTFVDPENNFTIEMEDLAKFMKKYYTSEGIVFPKEEKRFLDHIDWPLPGGPGPSPSVPDGMQAIWTPGIPGTPPGIATWTKTGASSREIPYPTGGTRTFEKPKSYNDKGQAEYTVPGIPPQAVAKTNSNPPVAANPKSTIFKQHHEPLQIDNGGTWQGTPGSPGTLPTEGSWKVVQLPPPPVSTADENSSKCSSCCFAPGTLVLMADGSNKKIEEIAVGESVLAFDVTSNIASKATVLEIEKPTRDHITTITFSDKSSIRLTNEHPLYSKKGWASLNPAATKSGHEMEVNLLRIGDYVRTSNNKWIRIVSILTELRDIEVYNLSKVKPFNTYYASNILVHNKGASQNDGSGDPDGSSGSAGVDGTSVADGSNETGSGANKSTGGGPGGANGDGTNSDGNGTGGAEGDSRDRSSSDPRAAGSSSVTNGDTSGSNTSSNSGNPGSADGSSRTSKVPNTGNTSSSSSPSSSTSSSGGYSAPRSAPAPSYGSYSGGV